MVCTLDVALTGDPSLASSSAHGQAAAVISTGATATAGGGATPTSAGSVEVGDHVEGRVSAPGEQPEHTFDGRAGDAIFVRGDRTVACEVEIRVLAPTGDVVARGGSCAGVGRIILPADGTYRFVIAAPPTYTGDYRFSVERSAPDERFDISLGDTIAPDRPAPGAGRIDVPGPQDIYVFQGRAGQTVTIHGGTGPTCFFVRPFDRTGSLQGLLSVCSDASFTVAVDGPVELRVGIGDEMVGEYSFRVDEG